MRHWHPWSQGSWAQAQLLPDARISERSALAATGAGSVAALLPTSSGLVMKAPWRPGRRCSPGLLNLDIELLADALGRNAHRRQRNKHADDGEQQDARAV